MGLQRMTGVLLNNRNQRKVESTMLKTKSDWDINMERILIKEKGDKKEKEVRIAGRCKSCWGGLIARRNEAYEWIEIKCRICGTTVEGQDAQKEKEKMLEEGISNLMMMNMGLGNNPKYGDGFFVGKLFPSIERQTNKEIKTRINKRRAEGNKQGKLTRNSFPAGAPGLLFLQAKILIKGVEDLSNLHERSIMKLAGFEAQDNGSIVVDKIERIREDGKDPEYRMMRRMGCYMSAAMLAAFACELAMKAICLTCKDEAIQDHDLLELYRDLPKASQRRTKADYEKIEKVMEKGRHIFGNWRYFETNVGEEGMRGMIDLERTLKMAKAARVILDEAEMVGLTGSIKRDTKGQVRVREEKRPYKEKVNIEVKGVEWPPKNV